MYHKWSRTRKKFIKPLLRYIFLIFLLIIVGCNDIADYDDTDIAAVVKDEEITLGDLRFLYPDDKALEFLDSTIKAKLAEQEVKRLNLDVSQELEEIKEVKSLGYIYPVEEDDSEFAKSTREFAEAQSAKFGMEPEEYYVKYYEKTQTINVYVIAYIEEMLGSLEDLEDTHSEKATALLDALLEDNIDEVQILLE